MGGTDIFKSELKDGKWQKPVNLGYPINSVEDDSFFAISADRRRAYFSTLREEGNAEIYTLTFVEPQQLADAIDLEPAQEPAPQVIAGIQPTEEPEVKTEIASRGIGIAREPEPTVAEADGNLSRKFLFFDIGKDILTNESLAQLEHVRGLLEQDQQINILIEGHTDNTGSDLLNKALSIARANAVAKFLTKHGIDPHRLSVKGYGDTRPLVSNDDERGGREINRRIEISMSNTGLHASRK
jgi:outer membrane protein OmpA-like peptidoglycan-associated protein